MASWWETSTAYQSHLTGVKIKLKASMVVYYDRVCGLQPNPA